MGSFVGHSTCNSYTSALGAGQKVLSYSYYTPWQAAKARYSPGGAPLNSVARFQELLEPLASSAGELYPDWRLRIYHNVSQGEPAWQKLCNLYCRHQHVDLCDVRQLPKIGDLNKKFPVGRFWRFQVLGDPTVEVFASRDVDSFLLPREKAAVGQWLEDSGKQFHMMRDLPLHHAPILAGLWGGRNYLNFSRALEVRNALLEVDVYLWKFYDQRVLKNNVWPLVRHESIIHDSYNCRRKSLGPILPWPTQREGFTYVGFGPSKGVYKRVLKANHCPITCRPKDHKDWKYC